MHKLLGFIFLFFLTASCKKTDFKNPLKNQYTVKGQFYYDYSLFPVPLADLVLYSENLNSISGKPKPIAYSTTTDGGYFEFVYNENKKYTRLFIQHEEKGNPVNKNYGVLLQNIDGNQNFEKDLFVKSFGYLNVKITTNKILTSSDTLYIGGLRLLKPTGIFETNLAGENLPGLKINFPLVSQTMGPFVVWYLGRLGEAQTFDAFWGIGKKEYLESLINTERKVSYTISGYPQTNQLTIEIK